MDPLKVYCRNHCYRWEMSKFPTEIRTGFILLVTQFLLSHLNTSSTLMSVPDMFEVEPSTSNMAKHLTAHYEFCWYFKNSISSCMILPQHSVLQILTSLLTNLQAELLHILVPDLHLFLTSPAHMDLHTHSHHVPVFQTHHSGQYIQSCDVERFHGDGAP